MEKFSYIAGYIGVSPSFVHQSVSDFYFDDSGIAPQFVGGLPTKDTFTAALTDTCREAAYEVVATAADNFHKVIIVYAHVVYKGQFVEFHKEYDQGNFIDFEDMEETVADDMVEYVTRSFGPLVAQLPE